MDRSYALYRAMMRRQRDSRGRFTNDDDREREYMGTIGFMPRIDDRRNERAEMRRRDFTYDGDRNTEMWRGTDYMDNDSNRYKKMSEKRQDGFAMSNMDDSEGRFHLSKKEAEEWVRRMKNADGTTGGHWTLQESIRTMEEKGIEANPYDFYAILNAMYSDYCKVAHEFGTNTKDFYIKMAKAFICDEDAVPDKVAAYYECIVE